MAACQVFLGEYKGGSVTPKHSHGKPMLRLVCSGGFREKDDLGKVQDHPPGSLLFMPVECEHDHTTYADGATVVAVGFSHEFLQEALPSPNFVREPLYRIRSAKPEHNLQLWEALFCGDCSGMLSLECWCIEALAHLTRQEEASDSRLPLWLRRVRERVTETYDETIELRTLAEEASVDRAHLARSFRSTYGCSIGEYQRALRLEAACRDLTLRSGTLSEIAVRHGFYDQAHFVRLFRTQFGVPPSSLRQRLRNQVESV